MQETILRVEGTGALKPVPYDFCQSGILTSSVCRFKMMTGSRRIETEIDPICEMTFCIQCVEGNN